jgi:hypothetical protein
MHGLIRSCKRIFTNKAQTLKIRFRSIEPKRSFGRMVF